jgi:hypothetical protein
MKHRGQDYQRLQQQKIAELRHQLRYVNTSQERDLLTMQIDAIRRHG